jgi:hypothetical protein
MLKSQITKEELDRLGAKVKSSFRLFELEYGLELQQKGYVYNTAILPDHKLVAKVQDAQVYDVQLDFDFLDKSKCTCSDGGYCKHMAAAFFYVFAVYGRPDAFVRNLKQEQQKGAAELGSKNTSALHRKTVLYADPVSGAMDGLKESAGPDQWQAYIMSKWILFTQKNQQHKLFIDDYYNAALHSITMSTQWWSRTPRLLFAVQTGLVLLKQLDADYQQRQTLGYMIPGDRHREASQALLEKWHAALRELDATDAASRCDEYLPLIADTVRMLLFDTREDTPFQAIAVYRLVWTRLLFHGPAHLLTQELEQLDAARRNTSLSEFASGTILLASVHFLLLHHKDDQAWNELHTARTFRPEQLLSFLEEWQQQQDWQRVWQWLERMQPSFRILSEKSFQQFCNIGNLAAQELGLVDEWLGRLSALLPRSYYAYTEVLMKMGRYRRWVNFHLAERIGLSSLYPVDMRAIEAHDPALLLPVYHQSIDSYIKQKNRTAYKEAIRLLRKLAAIYKQLDRQDRYEAYIAKLTRHYSRLRAFQEELKRGKLIR